ncbi:acetyl-CoA carboxylase biotin carboxyl carrier protein [Saccharopolyspora indica]|uniref:acetyl-CoA carboxylase biotin carboxyl carrier protein n=1 Tax=Saccharopolyspora indica TaxID=1229659 RepID=UPI0022EB3B80|nr:acetyl-CoA carboxylase biotin carboxyl carrier protein [Saccharopolyspora indica]MDA3647675.1 acetyl-CoA carboxylase biotin carboxyl carrier protein [Saccharopolyspora indica]
MTEVQDRPESELAAVRSSVAEVLALSPRAPQRIRVQLGAASVEMEWPETAASPAASPVPESGPSAPELPAVRSPLVGTFYRAPEPNSRPFVAVGDLVQAGQQVAIVEAMKLMNPVEADRAGRVAEILVGDAEPVEFGQPLLLIDPVDEERGR